VNRVRGRGRGFSVHMGTDKLTSRQLLFSDYYLMAGAFWNIRGIKDFKTSKS
jgi:hypothetical protein